MLYQDKNGQFVTVIFEADGAVYERTEYNACGEPTRSPTPDKHNQSPRVSDIHAYGAVNSGNIRTYSKTRALNCRYLQGNRKESRRKHKRGQT